MPINPGRWLRRWLGQLLAGKVGIDVTADAAETVRSWSSYFSFLVKSVERKRGDCLVEPRHVI